MPITVACPQCSTTLKAPDSAAGRKVKCPKCSTPFDVPAAGPVQSSAPPVAAGRRDEYADEPAPRRRRRDDYDDYDDEPPVRRRDDGGQNESGAQFGLGIAALSVGAVGLVFAFIPLCGAIVAIPACAIGLILGVVGLIIGLTRNKQGLGFPIAGSAVSFVGVLVALAWWLWFARATQEVTNVQREMLKAMQQNARPPAGLGGAVIMTKNEQITAQDPPDRVRRHNCKTYPINMTAGKTYQIDMISVAVDSYLRLEDNNGVQLAFDDDGGGFPNARITFVCPRTDAYRIICTTFNGGQGPFTMTVQER
jgi:hypothetical protein